MSSQKNRYQSNESFFRHQMRPRLNAALKRDPEVAVESHLIRLKQLDSENLSFWEDYWGYLSREREKILDDIKDTIYSFKAGSLEIKNLSRIVSGEYGHDPLCSFGSSTAAGGRFNFGQISSSLASFQALYVAEDYATAFCEKYLYRENEDFGNKLRPQDLQFEDPASNVHIRVDVQLNNYLDLGVKENLQGFLELISKIEPTEDLQARAYKLRMGKLNTLKTLDKLFVSIFEENFKQWPTWLDQPSNSQWLGHYAKEAGIQGIKYPSCRNTSGFNIAIFTKNFENTDSSVEITDKVSFVEPLRKKIDGTNYLHYYKGVPAPYEKPTIQ